MFDYKPTWYFIDGLMIYCLLAFSLSGLLIFLSSENPEKVEGLDEHNDERLSMYECGFDPFKEPQETYLAQFFVVSILFLIFDIELLYLLPWAMAIDVIQLEISLLIIFLFFLGICIGLFVEWHSETLNWIKSNLL